MSLQLLSVISNYFLRPVPRYRERYSNADPDSSNCSVPFNAANEGHFKRQVFLVGYFLVRGHFFTGKTVLSSGMKAAAQVYN